MNNDNDDNIVSFPIEERRKKIETEQRAKEQTKPAFGQFGSFSYSFDPNITVTFSQFDKKESETFTLKKETFFNQTFPSDLGVNYNSRSIATENDRLFKFMDMCNHIQKRATVHYSNNNDTLFSHMEALLEQLVQISNLNKKS